METARRAGRDDLAELARMWEAALGELTGQRGGGALAASLTRSDLTGSLSQALSDPDRCIVVGEIDSVAAGLASARLERGAPGAPALADLELIFVEPWARQVGLGEAMLEVVMAAAADWGAVGIDAPALPGNRGAKSFFESHGFQARLLVMHRSSGG